MDLEFYGSKLHAHPSSTLRHGDILCGRKDQKELELELEMELELELEQELELERELELEQELELEGTWPFG